MLPATKATPQRNASVSSQLSLTLAKFLCGAMDISPDRTISSQHLVPHSLENVPFRVNDPPIVLVVDDDNDNLQLACYVVEQAGYRALSASSGKDALAQVQAHSIQLILLDIVLPDLDGFQVLAQIRQQTTEPAKIPMVAITALASEPEKQQMLAAGFSTCLCKPYAIDDLEALLQRYCPFEIPRSLHTLAS